MFSYLSPRISSHRSIRCAPSARWSEMAKKIAQPDKWNFCLNAAKIVAEQESR
jgi:hypothetical protein